MSQYSRKDDDGCFYFIIVLLVLYGAFLLIVYVIIPVLTVAISVGILIGSGHAIHNYFVSFTDNVKPE